MKYKSTGSKVLALAAVLVLAAAALCGCTGKTAGYQKNAKLNQSESIRLVVAGSWTDSRGMELAAQGFTKLYPNCKVEYEYLQNYQETLEKRVYSPDDRIDLFITSNILEDSDRRAYALDLLSYQEQLPLTDAFPGMLENFTFTGSDGVRHMYTVALGGEMRGLFVNTTLLASLDIAIPTNRSEFLAACEKLKAAGYIPIQDNSGTFGQRLLFPYIAHLIADADDVRNVRELFATCDENAVGILRDPLEFLYNLTAAYYYNYKYVEVEQKRFLDLSDEGMTRSFLNIVGSEGAYEKADDLGQVPFMPATDSLLPALDKGKSDYHSQIEYQFILAPVSASGGYAYMSPSQGIAVNKNSFHLDWALEFMNYLFSSEANKAFAQAANITPNTRDALEMISQKYQIPVKDIGQPEDVTFHGFNFYNLIYPSLLNTAKANNPKYMIDDGQGHYTMHPFSYYLDSLKEAFAQQRALLKE